MRDRFWRRGRMGKLLEGEGCRGGGRGKEGEEMTACSGGGGGGRGEGGEEGREVPASDGGGTIGV